MKPKFSGKIHIVYDGMWGSCGKGKFCGELALDPKLNIQVCVNNNAPNAGHSFVFDDGRKVITKHIPIGFVNKNISYLVIGESAIIDFDRLLFELTQYKDILNGRQIYIADTAAVISDRHRQGVAGESPQAGPVYPPFRRLLPEAHRPSGRTERLLARRAG